VVDFEENEVIADDPMTRWSMNLMRGANEGAGKTKPEKRISLQSKASKLRRLFTAAGFGR